MELDVKRQEAKGKKQKAKRAKQTFLTYAFWFLPLVFCLLLPCA
jgi:hypothetical protein